MVKVIANVSYNGRIWEGEKKDWNSDTKEIKEYGDGGTLFSGGGSVVKTLNTLEIELMEQDFFKEMTGRKGILAYDQDYCY